MPRYDVPKLADYSGAINSNNSMIQAFANLGRQSQDYLNYDQDKKKNEWEKAFKMDDFINKDNKDKRDYDYKLKRDAIADKQWQDEYTANDKYRTGMLDVQKQAVNNRGTNPLDDQLKILKIAQIQQEQQNVLMDKLVNGTEYLNSSKENQALAKQYLIETGQLPSFSYQGNFFSPIVPEIWASSYRVNLAKAQQEQKESIGKQIANELANMSNKQIIANHNNNYSE